MRLIFTIFLGMGDVDADGEASGPRTWAGFIVRYLEWCTGRIGPWLELRSSSHVRKRVRFKFRVKVNLG